MTSQTPRVVLTSVGLAGLVLISCKGAPPPGNEHEIPTATEAPAARCPESMVHVPAGSFISGAAGEEIDFYPDWPGIEHLPRPRQTRNTDAFCVDLYEYPNVKGEMPRAFVSWDDAVALCAQRNRRLCTENEWSKACAGEQGLLFPYGSTYQVGICHADVTEDVGEARWIRPAGELVGCISPYGAFDLEGSLSEWVDAVPHDDDPELRILRGGTMWVGVYGRGCMTRHRHHHSDASHEDDGFRCCSDPI